MITLLSAPETLTSPNRAHRYIVQLVSTELELDSHQVPVPKETKIIDVCVTEPTALAIATLLEAAGYLQAHQIERYWIPQDCDCF